MANNKIEKLENLFDTVKKEVKSLHVGDVEILDDDQYFSLPAEKEPMDYETALVNDEVFSLVDLKKDYILCRRNLLRLVNSGQSLLANAMMNEDAADMKASQIDALSKLQTAIGQNLKLMIEVYQMIMGIEKDKKDKGTINIEGENGSVNIQQNTVFVGSTSELLKHLKENKQNEVKPI